MIIIYFPSIFLSLSLSQLESIVSEIDNFLGRLLNKGFDKLEEYHCTIAGSLTRILLRKVQRWLVRLFHGENGLPNIPRYDSKTSR